MIKPEECTDRIVGDLNKDCMLSPYETCLLSGNSTEVCDCVEAGGNLDTCLDEDCLQSIATTFVDLLTEEQKVWWNDSENATERTEIQNFLAENGCDAENQEFAQEIIDQMILNPLQTFNFLLNNRTDFDTNQGEVENYTSGGFDKNEYQAFNPQTQPWTSINSVIPSNKFVGWGTSGIRRNCMDYAKAQIAVSGYQISSYYSSGQTFQIYTTQNGVNTSMLSQGLSYLKYALSNGIPVIVGVDDKLGHPGNLDNTTDHFIVIVGMGSDANGNYFQFYDNADSEIIKGTSDLNRLYYNHNTGIISGLSKTDYAQNQGLIYTVTMIRKSKLL